MTYPAGAVEHARPALVVAVPRARRRPPRPRARGVRRCAGLLRAAQPADLLRAAGRQAGEGGRWAAGQHHRHLGRLRRLARRRPELWAIPKDLCEFERDDHGHAVQRTSWSTTWTAPRSRRPASPTSPATTLRTPFKGSTWQQRLPTRAAPTGRSLPSSPAARRRSRAAAPGTSTSKGRSAGWQASGPSRRSG